MVDRVSEVSTLNIEVRPKRDLPAPSPPPKVSEGEGRCRMPGACGIVLEWSCFLIRAQVLMRMEHRVRQALGYVLFNKKRREAHPRVF